MIPTTLRQLLDATRGQRLAEWQGREVWLAREPWGELAVSLQGAQVLHFLPAPDAGRKATDSIAEAEQETADPAAEAATLVPGGWLWVTPTPQPLPGAIRGGIPLCWPWFADESPDGQGPMHGPARKAAWRLDAADEHEEGVELHLSPQDRLHEQLVPRAVIQANARRLHVELITEHRGTTPVKYTGALHSYFGVRHTHRCKVEGLAGARYLDKLKNFAEDVQQGEPGIRGAIDRIYQSNREVVLDDGERRLRIAKQGSDSTVVWHPDSELPQDTPPEAGHRFVCVEAACTRLDPVWLVPGAQHLLATTISCEENR
ncbi:glucose-6-phosphate 1-epimerase [Modicisalibacter ilicicola DSM 19980]|uniref:glucose-6-phosphate 1-epimerase n=1 Tax=Modicisalibacter ilicicola DSM 19980 TaxID=1121942 RepID=A0A1M4T4X3_9GAMM|nr:D-hexose-6-phosphate mutarotase [Halomonas ilicicola]SHE39435.1 glucose-6-phosphate 1-epimerase [Halomonas ilicicola DSM 19980]